ncbi:hypothetical protein [Falsirhodobacter algicola]|uniref:Porin n=1 Tax=Falsirhodobacter algicola TaxID=2692330 RepID=A0A8J8MUI2_9RHOB|nr:hypothetical protein [Falsirhodobacter algicola]QUS36468.1 hypothetical protein GR316_09465 [Falsirhodobacter algicola]
MKTLATAGAVALAVASPAMAVELTGGTVSLGYSQMLDQSDLKRHGLEGSAELALTPDFSVQVDLGVSKFHELDDTEHHATLHGIWHNGPADLGVFYGKEKLESTRDYYGFELGQSGEGWSAQLYLGRGENTDWDGGIAGISGKAFLTPVFDMGLAYDTVNVRGIDARKVAVTADYMIAPQWSVGAELGTFDSNMDEVDGSQGYVGLNATMHFGRTGDTMFGSRGVLAIIPGL